MEHNLARFGRQIECLRIEDAPLDQGDAITKGFEARAVTGREIVDDANFVSAGQQTTHKMVADEPAASRDQRSHEYPPRRSGARYDTFTAEGHREPRHADAGRARTVTYHTTRARRRMSIIARDFDDDDAKGTGPSLLMVATVSETIQGFLTPYATHFRHLGWRVEAAANGVTAAPRLEGVFDQLHELPWSRSILDIGGILGAMRALTRILESGFDIVHVHTPIAAFVTRAAIRRMPADTRPAVVYTAHGFHFYPGGGFANNAVFLTAERLAGRWTDRLVVINDEDHAAALRHRIVPRRRLRLMPGIGLDTRWYSRSVVPEDEIAASRTRLGISPGSPLFTVVGELSIRKRPYDVVAALGLMKHRDCHLVLVGDGPARPRVEAAIRESGVGDRVHLVGVMADVRPFVAASTVLVLASRMEGLPRCVMEALSLEVPVVATDARGSPDLVEPDAGLIVPVGDVVALAQAMDRMLDDPDGARAMAVRGRTRMAERYDLSILLADHEALYREVLLERMPAVPVGRVSGV